MGRYALAPVNWFPQSYQIDSSNFIFYIILIPLSKYTQHYDSFCPRCGYHNRLFLPSTMVLPHHSGLLGASGPILYDRMCSPLSLCPKQCLLGLLPDRVSNKHHHTFLQETLFTAGLLLTKMWLQASPPTEWMAAVSLSLSYKKVIYIHRKCPATYHKIWDG